MLSLSFVNRMSWRMEKRLPNVLKLLEGAKDGDEECLRLLKLQHGYDYDPPPVFDPAKCKDMDEMRDAVSELAYLVASFKKLGLDHCERKTRVALSYMLHVLEAQTGKKAKTVKNLDGEGIAEDCLGVVTDLCGTADLLVIINDMEERRLQKLKDNEGSEDSMEEEEQSDDKSDDDKSENEEEEGESEEEGSTDDDDIGEEAEDATSKSSSHHVNRKCLVKSGCAGYCGPNLRRHLVNVHANKNHIRHQDVDRFFAMGLHYKRKRGPSRVDKKGKAVKGRWKRWCPEPFCPYLGAYLPEHLQNKHRMKQCSAKYRTALKIARRYKGVKEEMDQMLPPEPPIVEVVAADQASLSPSDGSDNDGCIPLHSTSLPKAKTSKTVAVCVSDSENVIPPTPLKATGSGKPAKNKETVKMKKNAMRMMKMCTPWRLTISRKRTQSQIDINGWYTFTSTCSPRMPDSTKMATGSSMHAKSVSYWRNAIPMEMTSHSLLTMKGTKFGLTGWYPISRRRSLAP